MVFLELIVLWWDYCALVIIDAPPLDLNDFIVQLSDVVYEPFPPCKIHQPFVPARVHHLMSTLASCSSHAHSYLNPCLQRCLATVPRFLHCEHTYKMALLVLSVNAWYRLLFGLSTAHMHTLIAEITLRAFSFPSIHGFLTNYTLLHLQKDSIVFVEECCHVNWILTLLLVFLGISAGSPNCRVIT